MSRVLALAFTHLFYRALKGGPRLAPCFGPWYGPAVSEVSGHEEIRDENGDVALVRKMARGDADALASLYDTHAPLLLSLVRRIVGSPEAAEDIVHDVFIEAWGRSGDYDPSRGSVRTWLALRARSRALDHKKSSAVARRVSLDEPRSVDTLLGVVDDASLAPDQARV